MRAGRLAMASDLSIEAAELVRRERLTTADALAVTGAGYLSAAMAFARAGDTTSAGELLEGGGAYAEQLSDGVSMPAVFGPSNVAIHGWPWRSSSATRSPARPRRTDAPHPADWP